MYPSIREFTLLVARVKLTEFHDRVLKERILKRNTQNKKHPKPLIPNYKGDRNHKRSVLKRLGAVML